MTLLARCTLFHHKIVSSLGNAYDFEALVNAYECAVLLENAHAYKLQEFKLRNPTVASYVRGVAKSCIGLSRLAGKENCAEV